MAHDYTSLDTAYSTSSGVQKNRVLRNTYALLALTLIPTALGAFLGLKVGLPAMLNNPIISVVVFLAVSFGMIWAIEKNKDSAMGVILLLAFTGFMGLMLSRLIGFALSFSNGASLIGIAALGTSGVFFGLASYASVTKRDFSGLGKFLMIGVVMLIVASIANVFLQLPALTLTLSTLAVGIFSLFLLYDLKRIIDGGETNYITATLSVYLNLYNIFSSLLQLLLAFSGNNRE